MCVQSDHEVMRRLFAAMFLIGLVGACGPAGTVASNPSPSSATSAAPPSAAASPSAKPTLPAGFTTTSVSGGSVSTSTVTAVRVGQHDGYDRFVIEFDGGVPSYTVTVQSSSSFTRSPKGDTVTLEGTSGVLIAIHSVTNWTSYSDPSSFHPQYPFLRQAMLVENFEGYQQWALGLQGAALTRVVVMSTPDRLVVDVVTV